MQTFAYFLVSFAAVFVINIVLSFTVPSYKSIFEWSGSSGQSQQEWTQSTEDEVRKEVTLLNLGEKQKEATEKIQKLEAKIEALEKKAATPELRDDLPRLMNELGIISGAKTTATGAEIAAMKAADIAKGEDVPLSWVLLMKIMPDLSPKKIPNDGIFNIHVLGNVRFNTYYDAKKKVKFFAFAETYDVMLANMKLLDKLYTVNETSQFFGKTFFLNPKKSDEFVRFVTFLEGRAVGVEVPKKFYNTLKTMLLKK